MYGCIWSNKVLGLLHTADGLESAQPLELFAVMN
jgi:hypothetical protein